MDPGHKARDDKRLTPPPSAASARGCAARRAAPARALSPQTHAKAVALASLALDIKGYGHIKLRNYKAAKARETALLAELRSPSPTALKAAE